MNDKTLTAGPRRNIIVCDIDGCLIDSDHRYGYYTERDMEAYHQAHVDDTYIEAGVVLYTTLRNSGYELLFITAREELARGYTLSQLSSALNYEVPTQHLLMRPSYHHESSLPDTVLKPQLLHRYLISHEYALLRVLMIFEDRNRMVHKWRELGYTCIQPREFDK